jgi:hypothetical protein
MAISERYAISDADNNLVTPLSVVVNNENRINGYKYELYRGDCYIC